MSAAHAAPAWITGRAGALSGIHDVPGDKSLSHRAVMLAALADGVSRIDGFLEGADTRATAAIFARMGVRIEAPADGCRIVHGVGLHGLRAPDGVLDCGNAGTAMRLLAGVLAGQRFATTLVGDASLSRRPMQRVAGPLSTMGVDIRTSDDGTPPLRLQPVATLRGVDHTCAVASAQVKSALLLAGLYAEGDTVVREPRPTRDYTERLLQAFGWQVDAAPGIARLRGGQRLSATDVRVPGDFSSAAFLLVAATVVPGSELVLRGVGLHPRRTGLLHVLRAMGADIREDNTRMEGGESIADLHVRHAPLRGIAVPQAAIPDMIDEFPVLAIAAACAEGATVVTGAEELRVKESDRLHAMACGLAALGVDVRETPGGVVIQGGRIGAGSIDSFGDHRIAMAFAVGGQVATGRVRIVDVGNVATSYPGFDAALRRAGGTLRDAG